MKLTDRKLKKLMRDNPIPVEAKRKDEVLEYIRTYSEQKEEKIMTKRYNYKLVLAVSAALLSITMLVSAAVVHYYYSTPDGGIVDKDGETIAENIPVETSANDRAIFGEGYHIRSVTWTMAEGRTTLAVWASNSSEELVGLRAVADGVEYPLEKTTFNLSGNFVGYTTTNFDKPTEFTLICDSPAFERSVTFMPDDVVYAESTSNGITVFGTTEGGTVYFGINDDHFFEAELFRDAVVSSAVPSQSHAYDSAENGYSSTGGMTSRGDELFVLYDYDVPQGTDIVSVYMPRIEVVYSFPEAADGKAPSVNVPLPNDGESIEGEWKLIDSDGFTFVINNVRREGGELYITSDEGIRYEGVYTTANDLPNYVMPALIGDGSLCVGGGNGCEFSMPLADAAITENGEVTVTVFEMCVTYKGEWELEFAE